MFTVESLRQYPSVAKAFTGVSAEEFWGMVAVMAERWAAYQQRRQARPDRQRAVGGGRRCEQELALRVAVVLTYLRLHVPQAVVGLLFGTSQAEVSRELREVLPALRDCLPCPAVWELIGDAAVVPAESLLPLEQVGGGRVLSDATEQRVSRPGDDATQRRYYSGKKKQHTLKTQLVTDGDHHILAISVAAPGPPTTSRSATGCTPWTACRTGSRPTPTRATRDSPRRSRLWPSATSQPMRSSSARA